MTSIRRKSDANRPAKDCAHFRDVAHEYGNQRTHDTRRAADTSHDPTAACWCCCDDCADLSWYYEPRKGEQWAASLSGEQPSTPQTYAG